MLNFELALLLINDQNPDELHLVGVLLQVGHNKAGEKKLQKISNCK